MVAINKFSSDTDKEIDFLIQWCKKSGYEVEVCDAFSKGGEGAIELANKVISLCEKDNSNFDFIYKVKDIIEDKISIICKEIYGAENVSYNEKAIRDIQLIRDNGLDKNLLICMAKTPNSLTDNAKIMGRPTGFRITVKELRVSKGAGFVVALTGAIMTIPGLPIEPAA